MTLMANHQTWLKEHEGQYHDVQGIWDLAMRQVIAGNRNSPAHHWNAAGFTRALRDSTLTQDERTKLRLLLG